MDLYEALYTTRAMRRVKPDPISEEVVRRMLDAAVRAPSGGNSQTWRFITVTEPGVKAQLGPLYREAFATLQDTVYRAANERARAAGDEQSARILRSSQWLADHFEDVPLWFFVYIRNDPDGSSIFPAVWNLMLAGRGQGVGTCLTTILGHFKAVETAGILGVPVDRGWQLKASVSAGYPTGRWGTAKRAPVHPIVYSESWGTPVSWAVEQPLWIEPDGYAH
jgi:nitroreductase